MHDLLIYLLVMVIVVPLSKFAGLGSIIGYLLAGAIIGPQGLGLLSQTAEGTPELAEFGVVMMLLLIGLELNPKVLWKMRGPIFGLGLFQVIASISVCVLALTALGQGWNSAAVIGMIISVSSTAIALQSLQESGYAKSIGGERAFSVLLFQDIAVIPMLALLPFLGAARTRDSGTSAMTTAIYIVGAVAVIIGGGRFVIHPLFKWIARTKLRETFTALALLIVVGAAFLMHEVGLSPALGAFLAGVVLADSQYRHQIEADIEPFKGLLLGLFFITIGTTIQFQLIAAQPISILGWVVALTFGKAIVVYAIGRAARLRPPESLLFAASLAQGGEFAFVLIGQSAGLLPAETAQILTAAVALSMALAPLLIQFTIRVGMQKLQCVKPEEREPDTVDESEKDNPVLVIGVGRFGQTLIRFLRANGFRSTVLDIDSEQIEVIARFGIKSYFGDGANLDLLRAAGLERARVLVIAIDEPETTLRIVEEVRMHYPELPIFARSYDRVHAYKLLHHGVTEVMIETSGSALDLGTELLKSLGMAAERAEAKAQLFYMNNQRSIRELSQRFHTDDRETFIQASKQMSEQLEALLKSDPEELLRGASSEWPKPPEFSAPINP